MSWYLAKGYITFDSLLAPGQQRRTRREVSTQGIGQGAPPTGNFPAGLLTVPLRSAAGPGGRSAGVLGQG